MSDKFPQIQLDPRGNIENPPYHNKCRVIRCGSISDKSSAECNRSSTTSTSISSTTKSSCPSDSTGTISYTNSTIDSIESCMNNKCNLKGCINCEAVRTVHLDTCTIRYKPRLIVVPSCEFRDINCAIQHLKKNSGGYVIELAKGTHCINTSVIDNVDNLTIIGDKNPFSGVGFINGGGVKFFTDPLLACERRCLPCDLIGIPPYSLIISGRKITVKGSGKDPNFSCIESDRKVTFFFVDGSKNEYLISAVHGNTITLSDNISINPSGLSSQINSGEGFVINPNVTITTNLDVLHISPSDTLKIKGVFFNVGYVVLGNNTTKSIELSNCVLPDTAQIFLLGEYHFNHPNTFNGVVNLAPAAKGIAYFQTFVGNIARLVADGCAPSAWKFSTFASSAAPVKILNGSNINFQGSHFVNNTLAMYVSDGSHATIYSCIFNANKFAILAIYNSVVSARTSFYLASFNIPPIFINNKFAISADYGAYIILPKSCICNNEFMAILDGKAYTSLESIPIGQYSSNNSLIILLTNPAAIDAGSTGAVNKDEQGALTALNDEFLGVAALQAIMTPSVISGNAVPQISSNGSKTINVVSDTGSGVTVTTSNNTIIVPNALGSGVQNRSFINQFGPVQPDALVSFLSCDPCSNIGNFA